MTWHAMLAFFFFSLHVCVVAAQTTSRVSSARSLERTVYRNSRTRHRCLTRQLYMSLDAVQSSVCAALSHHSEQGRLLLRIGREPLLHCQGSPPDPAEVFSCFETATLAALASFATLHGTSSSLSTDACQCQTSRVRLRPSGCSGFHMFGA